MFPQDSDIRDSLINQSEAVRHAQLVTTELIKLTAEAQSPFHGLSLQVLQFVTGEEKWRGRGRWREGEGWGGRERSSLQIKAELSTGKETNCFRSILEAL